MALPDCEELNGVEQFCKNCETELHSSERCVIQDKRVFEENSTGAKTERSETILQKL